MKKTIALITGASSGIGAATAIDFLKQGFTVYAGARNTAKIKHLEDKGIIPIELDVEDDASMVNCVKKILKKEGTINILVNCAGYGSYGSVEDVPMSEAKKQMEVNVFGLARMTQLVLPTMRRNKSGKIINISSVGGKIWSPFGGWYHTTKFAVEGLSNCMRMELAPFGIDVIIIEPGLIKTNWGLIAADNLEKVSANGAYAKTANEVVKGLRKKYNSNSASAPEVVSACITKAALSKRPRTSYSVGSGAKIALLGKYMLPDRLFDVVLKKYF